VIVTFYSYKGGVGRSMALANVAAWFRLQGLQVVMIDWDLEAPGLESFFATDPAERDLLRAKVGLVDLISMYKDVFPSLPKPVPPAGSSGERSDPLAEFIDKLDQNLPPIAHTLIPIRIGSAAAGTGKLWLLSAGCRSESRFDGYAQAVQQFDWEEFYASYEGEAYFEWMRRQLLKPGMADVVLIDSRTGVAEMSGVCTRQLADVVVMLCAPNDQNLEGVAAMARSFTRPDVVEARGGRPIQLLSVPARVDVSEGRPVDLFEERFRQRLDPFIPKSLRPLPAPKTPLRIPYIREYAYAEQLAIGAADGVKTLQRAYVTLAAHLVALAGADSVIKRQCRTALQETFGLPSILVASLDPTKPDFATGIRARLEAAGVMTVYTNEKSEGAVETAGAARRSATRYGAVVLAGPSYSADTRIRDLWRRSREIGVTLMLAVETGKSAGNDSPRWSRRVPVYDVGKGFDELVQALQSPIPLAPIPFMAPPVRPGFVGRTHEIAQIKELLSVTPGGATEPAGTAARTRTVAIVGLAGIGKTALARAVCHDDDVIDTFDDGIVWMTLGSEADLLNAAASVLSAFGEDVSGLTHIEEAERRIAVHLSNKRCLVVVDDVFDVAHRKLISSIGPQTRAIVTTQDRHIAAAIAAATFALPPLSATEARTWMSRQGLSPDIPAQVAEKLGNVPLALELAEQTLNRGVPAKDLIERIDDEGLIAIETDTSDDASDSLFASLMSALEGLPPEDRLRLPLLASLPPSRPVDLVTVAKESNIGLSEGEAMARRVAAVSLIDFDDANRTVTISPLIHAFLRSLQLRQDRAEANRRSGSRVVKGVIGISYRRDDAAAMAGRLYDRLGQRFGPDRVFMDDAIPPGEDFVRAIRRRIDGAAAWLVLIGPNWASSVNSRGERRLDDPDDFVRIEIAAALEHGIPVIPVLLDGAAMPRSEELPPELQRLVRRHAAALDHRGFEQGVDKLIHALEQVSSGKMQEVRSRRRRLVAWAVGATWVALTLVMLIWVGYPPVDNALGRMFESGIVVPKNLDRAIEYYKRAAGKGDLEAKAALARLGVKK
jgi:hypothetical protein